MKTFTAIRPLPKELVNAYNTFDSSGNSPTMHARICGVSRGLLLKLLTNGIFTTTAGFHFQNNEHLQYWLEIVRLVVEERMPLEHAARLKGSKSSTIMKNLSYFGYTRDNLPLHTGRVDFNRSAFFTNTADKWYWIGFLMADGNIYRNEIRLKLGERDLTHLQRYCTFLDVSFDQIKYETSDHESYKRPHTTCKVVVCGKEIVEYLATLNLVPQKSMKEIPPSSIPTEFKRDFIRGYFDGDGCIRSNLAAIGIVGSQMMLTWIRDTLVTELDVTPSCVKRQKGDLFQVGWFNIADMALITDYMYYESETYLDRKFYLYNELLGRL